MTNTEFDRVIRRVKKAREYVRNTLTDEKSTEEQREHARFLEEDIELLVESMCQYTCSVFDDNYKNANREQIMETYTNTEDFQREGESIERRRKNSHDGLITIIKLTDNACRSNGLEEIYGELPEEYKKDTSGLMGEENRKKPGVVETRHAIADWCFDFVLSATVGMYMAMEEVDYQKNADDYKKVSEDFKYKRGGTKGAKETIMELTDPDF